MKHNLTKKYLALAAVALTGIAAQAQITLGTDAEIGKTVKLLPNAVSSLNPISIDWGNGVEMKYTVDPSRPAYNRWIEGTIEGDHIIINGQLTELTLQEANLTSCSISGMPNLKNLDLSKNKLESFELLDHTPLEDLNLSYNQIYNAPSYYPMLTLEQAGSTLKWVNISHNEGLQCLDIRYLENLQYLTLNDCPDFASIFIAMPGAAHTSLRNINISNCDLAHFYPISMPELTSLDLANNALMGTADDSPFVLGDYPKLTTLALSDNPALKVIDVTSCTKLERLLLENCGLTNIDVAQAPNLISLNLKRNNIKSLDLGNNKSLTALYIADNPIADLDVRSMDKISDLDISGTRIPSVDLLHAYYLQTFLASNSQLSFVDFNGVQPGRLRKVDLRNSPNFTYESMAYTVKTLPQARKSYDTNLFLEGSNAEKADTEFATSSDMQWICDVQGDGSAQWDPVTVNLIGATDTGENKTGRLDRLYPLMGMSLDYDLDVMETTGGKFILAQWQKPWFQTVASVNTSALNGVPMYVYAYPEEGRRFKSVTVNGKEIPSQWFIVSEPSDIKVNFTAEESSIALNVPQGQTMSMLVNTVENNGSVWIDWGTGARTEYSGQRAYTSGTVDIKGTRIDGSAAGPLVTIYGNIAALDASGFGDVAEDFGLWDNHITGIDLSNAPDLKFLSLYWNPVSEINLEGAQGLEVLNLSYTDLATLDLSQNPNIMWLEAYSDGSEPGDGISPLTEIDLSAQKFLQYLDLKGNQLSSIDLSQNSWLMWLDVNGNCLTSLDLSANTQLEEVNVSRNQLTALDLSGLVNLMDLSIDKNYISSLDLSGCPEMAILNVANNQIKSLDLSMLTKLRRLWINGNGMTAPELNDLYYLLPRRDSSFDDQDPYQLSYNLAVIQGGDLVENQGLRADSSIAEDRGWSPSHTGSNGGDPRAYLDILSAPNGSVTVVDADGNEYGHGSKVEKYLPLTIQAAPSVGYYLKGFSLNGEPREGNTFDMPGIYTKLMPSFAQGSGVDALTEGGLSIIAARGQLIVKTDEPVEVNVFDLAGMRVSHENVETASSIALAKGIYLVKAGTLTATVAIR